MNPTRVFLEMKISINEQNVCFHLSRPEFLLIQCARNRPLLAMIGLSAVQSSAQTFSHNALLAFIDKYGVLTNQ